MNKLWILLVIGLIIIMMQPEKKEWGIRNAWPDDTTCTLITNVYPVTTEPWPSYINTAVWVMIDADNDGTKEAYGLRGSTSSAIYGTILIEDFVDTAEVKYNEGSNKIYIGDDTGFAYLDLDYRAAADAVDICTIDGSYGQFVQNKKAYIVGPLTGGALTLEEFVTHANVWMNS